MDVLWDSTEPLTVRQVGLRLTNRDLAHTTVMTVLDRLAKKGFARRQRDGRAWRYQAAAKLYADTPLGEPAHLNAEAIYKQLGDSARPENAGVEPPETAPPPTPGLAPLGLPTAP